MGTCFDRFFVGVCCKISQGSASRNRFTSIRNSPALPSAPKNVEKSIPMIDIAHFNVTLNTKRYSPYKPITTTIYPTYTDNPRPETTTGFEPHSQISSSSLLHRMFPSLSLSHFQSLLSPKGNTAKPRPDERTSEYASTTPSSIISWRNALRIPFLSSPSDRSHQRKQPDDKNFPTKVPSHSSWERAAIHGAQSRRDHVPENPPFGSRKSPVHESHNNRRPVQVEHDRDIRRPVQNHSLHDLRKPVVVEDSRAQQWPGVEEDQPITHPYEFNNQRRPVQSGYDRDLKRPVQDNSSHYLRKPVQNHPSHDLRRPVQNHHLHNLRKPVMVEESHDQRWPVVEEDEHDLRNPLTYDYEYDVGSDEKGENRKDSGYQIPVSDLFKGIEILLDDKNKYSIVSSTESPFWSSVMRSELATRGTTSKPYSKPVSPLNTFQSNPQPNDNKILTTFNKSSYYPTTSSAYEPLMDLTRHQNSILSDSKIVCGRPRGGTTARIVGGRKSHHLRWPWMVSLREMEGMISKHICGATLLNHYWTITAAHCVEGRPPTHLTLRLGEATYRRRDLFHPSEERRVFVMVVHPGYNGVTYENDLALLRTRDAVHFGPGVLPACLPDHPDFADLTGRTGIVTGWGRLAENGDLPSFLHQVHLPILSNRECERMYHEAGYVEEIRNMFVCAGTADGGLDACDGDSGGPLVVSGPEGEWTLAGVISWGMGCGAPKQPGVYIRMTEFTSWISSIISH